jgi:hypothetical protein
MEPRMHRHRCCCEPPNTTAIATQATPPAVDFRCLVPHNLLQNVAGLVFLSTVVCKWRKGEERHSV